MAGLLMRRRNTLNDHELSRVAAKQCRDWRQLNG